MIWCKFLQVQIVFPGAETGPDSNCSPFEMAAGSNTRRQPELVVIALGTAWDESSFAFVAAGPGKRGSDTNWPEVSVFFRPTILDMAGGCCQST